MFLFSSLCVSVCVVVWRISFYLYYSLFFLFSWLRNIEEKGASSVVTLERGGNRCELYLWLDILFSLLRIAPFIQIHHQHEIDGYLIKAWLVNQMR